MGFVFSGVCILRGFLRTLVVYLWFVSSGFKFMLFLFSFYLGFVFFLMEFS